MNVSPRTTINFRAETRNSHSTQVADARRDRTILAKNFLITSCLVLIAVFFAACSSSVEESISPPTVPTEVPTNTPAEVEQPQETQVSLQEEGQTPNLICTISLWHSFDENEVGSLQEISNTFLEFHPDIEFDFLYAPNYDLKRKFEESVLVGAGPSIMIGSGDWGPSLYDQRVIHDVSGMVESDLQTAINSAALDAYQYQGALIGLPLNLRGVVMFRNTEIIPEPPVSFDELIITAQTATEGDVVGAYLDYGLFYSAGHLEAIGGSLMDSAGNPAFNDEKGIEWLEMITRFEEAGPVDINAEDDISLFLQGRVGVIIDVLANSPSLVEAIGPEMLAIDPWPDKMSGFVQSEGIYLNGNLDAQTLECSWSFMEFLLSEEAQMIFSDPTLAGFIPSILGLELEDPLQAQASAAFAGGTTYPGLPEMSAYWGPLNFALESVVEFSAEPSEALDLAEVEIIAKIAEIQGE